MFDLLHERSTSWVLNKFWNLPKEGRKFGKYKGLDYLALTALMCVAEKRVGGYHESAEYMRRDILEEEGVSEKVIDEIIEEIEKHTVLKGACVYNKDPKTGKLSRRYAPD